MITKARTKFWTRVMWFAAQQLGLIFWHIGPADARGRLTTIVCATKREYIFYRFLSSATDSTDADAQRAGLRARAERWLAQPIHFNRDPDGYELIRDLLAAQLAGQGEAPEVKPWIHNIAAELRRRCDPAGCTQIQRPTDKPCSSMWPGQRQHWCRSCVMDEAASVLLHRAACDDLEIDRDAQANQLASAVGHDIAGR